MHSVSEHKGTNPLAATARSVDDDRTVDAEALRLPTSIDRELAILSPEMREDLEAAARRRIKGRLRQWIDPSDMVQEVQKQLLVIPACVTSEVRTDPEQLYAFSARLLERRIVDTYRNLITLKRGGGRERVEITASLASNEVQYSANLEAEELIGQLSDSLSERDPKTVGRVKTMMELLSVGYTSEEIGEKLGVSTRTVQRDMCKLRPLILALRERENRES